MLVKGSLHEFEPESVIFAPKPSGNSGRFRMLGQGGLAFGLFSHGSAATGSATHRDFRVFTAALRDLEGGVVFNFGSAVVLPEVFLKALSTARTLGHECARFTAANFDQIRHYRPEKNVLERPLLAGGKGTSFVGPHELWVPLLAALYLARAPRPPL